MPGKMKRFWDKVHKTSDCWLWTAAKHVPAGYGMFHVAGKTIGAHRISYEDAHGPIPPGLVVMHSCDVPACVNPQHLFAVTQAVNLADMTAKGRDRKAPPEVVRGQNNGNSSLSEAQVKEIRKIYAEGSTTMTDLGAAHGVHPSTIRFVVIRRNRRHVA